MSTDIHPALYPALGQLAEIRRRRERLESPPPTYEPPSRHAPIFVRVAGAERAFTVTAVTAAQCVVYLKLTEAIESSTRTAVANLEEEESLALTADLYLEAVTPILTDIILTTPADGGLPLTAEDVQAMDAGEPFRVLAAFEDWCGITHAAANAQQLMLTARALRSRRLQAEIDALQTETETTT